MSASVKIMRSYDYCHFEICLGSEYIESTDLTAIDNMRKEAMRLVDKAVEQYQVAKKVREWPQINEFNFKDIERRARTIKENYPESEWMPEQKQVVKEYADAKFRMERTYDYEDDYDMNFD